MQHARELAREACDGGEIVAAMGGDGIVGAVAGELRDGQGLLALLPGGRGNDFARKLGIPFDPVEAAKLLSRRRGAAGRPRRGQRHRLPRHPLRRHGLRRQPDRARDPPEARHVRLHLRRAARDRSLAPGRRGSSRSTARPPSSPATASRSATAACSAAACTSPRTRARGRAARRRDDRRQSKLALPARAPARVQRQPPAAPGDHIVQGREITFSADRPFTAYADGDPIGDLPLTVKALPGSLRVVAPR